MLIFQYREMTIDETTAENCSACQGAPLGWPRGLEVNPQRLGNDVQHPRAPTLLRGHNA